MNQQAYLEALAEKLATEARNMGCRGVIIALSQDEIGSEHSVYYVTHKGPCLEVEGLLQRIIDQVKTIWDGKITRR